MITIALSKGRILKQTLPLLENVGITLKDDPFTSRKLIFETNRDDLQCVVIRATDVPTYVQFGAADLGVVGKDGLLEHGGEGLAEILDLKISKCRLMTAVRAEDVDQPRTQKRLRVATKYVKSAQQYYQAQGIQAEIIKLYGAMELAPLVGLADEIVDLVETGNTLKANKLVAKDLVADISCRLIANAASMRVSGVDGVVAQVIQQVRDRGDQALYQYTQEFDGFDAEARGLEVPQFRLQKALQEIPPKQLDALKYAVERVRNYHEKQTLESWSYTENNGTQLGQKVLPMKRVGLYVPGGKATYPSSVIMNAVPAKVAGVPELIMTSPTPNGEFNDMVLAAAVLSGVDKVYRIGGAQAVAALAYGTETVPSVDKITGPGNIYVATAKKQVFGKVGIDMIAGPSEVLVIADESVDPDWVAMDLFAQAEHDEIAQSILLTQSELVAERVQQSINKLLPQMERADIIQESLKNNGALIVAETKEQIVEVADEIAAEHLEIFTEDADLLADQISNAGAIFIGPYSAESLGDYCAGPNHVLPTSGTARFSSALGVYDFQKRTSILKISKQGAQEIGKQTSVLARGESLTAHARSAEFRLEK